MGNPSVVLANEPRAYRETIAVALGMLCPNATIYIAEPERLDEFVREYQPQIVLCSELTDTVRALVPTWAVLYPDGAGEALLQIDGRETTWPEIELNGLVCLINMTDEATSA